MALTLQASDLAYHAATLALRATTADNTATTTSSTSTSTSTSSSSSSGRPAIYKTVGIILAVASGLFIGVSFVLKKVGLLKANVKYNEEAGEGYGYLKNLYWWSGMTLMIIGEICNFVAYAFTDAILVTPLGALSVVITTILSAIFLKERLSFVGKIGCFICILGSVIIPLNAPEQSAVANIQEMQHYVITPGFLTYAGVIIAGSTFTAFWAGPRYGKKSMLVYLSICSLVGGLSVVCTQGLGSAILAQINGEAQFNKWFTYVLLVFVIATLVTEIIFLNKALNIFNAALVTPTYYVYFTSSTIVASAVLFQGLHGTTTQIVDVVLGFLTICSGVVLLQLAKSAKDVPDTAVLKGDLDQVRTVAEQEEPEYEPRADTIRGGAGIVRAMSRVRARKEGEEAKRIHEEKLQSMAEANGAEYEWDGLRRRPTVSSAGGAGSVRRRKTVHPPLGMSHFPPPSPHADDDDEAAAELSDADSDLHPGFFGRITRRSRKRSDRHHPLSDETKPPVPLSRLHTTATAKTASSKYSSSSIDHDDDPREHVYGLPPALAGHRGPASEEETEYKGASTFSPPSSSAGPHIHFASDERPDSRGSSLAPPKPPPHAGPAAGAGGNRRQFSFQNVFARHRDGGATPTPPPIPADSSERPLSRGALSFVSRGRNNTGNSGAGSASASVYPGASDATEEERAGLVLGDSNRSGRTSRGSLGGGAYAEPDAYDDDDEIDEEGRGSYYGDLGSRWRGGGGVGGLSDDDDDQSRPGLGRAGRDDSPASFRGEGRGGRAFV